MRKHLSIGILYLLTPILLIQPGYSNGQSKKEYPDKVKHLDIAGATIAYKTYGQGMPFILCMGYSGNMDLWDGRLIDLLSQQYQVIVFDYRGMGYSTNTDTNFSINTLSEDVYALCQALKIDNAHVMGWSMGGYVAQLFAINHPEKVNKLILYATDCGDTITIPPDQTIADMLSDTSSTALQFIGALFPEKWLASNPEPWKYFAEVKEPHNRQTILLQDKAVTQWLSPGGGSAGRLHELNMPTLIISGDNDVIVLYENTVLLADSISGSTLIKMPNGGHGLMFQYPETFGNYVLSFLAQ